MTTTKQVKPKREVIRIACGCGAMISQKGHTMHEASKAHQAWLESQNVIVDVPDVEVEEPDLEEELHPDLQAVIKGRNSGINPRHLAKMVRAFFGSQDWPSIDHPGNVQDFLVEHGIPIIVLPRHTDPDSSNRYNTNWANMLKVSSWGTANWDIQIFEENWRAFLEEERRVASAQAAQ